MSSLPFSRLLDVLRTRGVSLGVREYIAYADLWQRLDGASAADLRRASAALLGTSAEDVRLVLDTFDELYGPPPAIPAPPPPPPPVSWWMHVRRRVASPTVLWAAGALAVMLAALGVWGATLMNAPLPSPPEARLTLPEPYRPAPPGTSIDLGRDVPPGPPPDVPPPPRTVNWQLLLPALAVAAIATLIAFQRPRASAAEKKRRERAWRQARASLPGPATFSLQPAAPVPWFDRRDLEDAATLLGRAFTTGLLSSRLDVRRTVHLTIAGGGLPTFVFEASAATGALLLLEDVGPEMEAWRAKTAAFVAALGRQGIRLDRWVFEGTPALVGREVTGERIALEELRRRSVSNGVLVISSGSGLTVDTPSPGPDWRDALASWTRRSWLNPVVSPAAWRPACAALPVNVWPFTGDGVLEAAADLAVDPDGRRGRRPAATAAHTVLADDVERLKRLVAVAGHPSLELVETLRRRFLPDTPEDTVLWVLRDAAHGSTREVRLPESEVQRLVAAERRENPERERAVRTLVLDLLASQPPPPGSVAALRWELAVATQRLALAHLDGHDAEAPLGSLRRLAESPIWDEVDESIRGLAGASGRLDVGRQAADGHLDAPHGLPAGAAAPSSPLRWLTPRPLELAVAAVVAGVVIAGLQAAGALTGAAIDHVQDAYRLEFTAAVADPASAGVLVVARGTLPAEASTAQLYRDGAPFGDAFDVPQGSVVERPVAVADAGHHFQVRATLPRGNLALSNTTWVAAPTAAAAVSVNALPWAIARILDAQGSQPVATGDFTTPFVVRLLPGRYVIELSHPDFEVVRQPVDVEAGRDAQVRVTLPGFDPAATARQLAPPASKQ